MKEYIVQAIAQETIDSFDAHNAPELVRCKNCKHRGEWERAEDIHGSYSRIVFPDGSLCPGQCEDQFYSWLPPDDWFCANGERKEGTHE